MSSRDIEGENPLYLPQAKMYDNSCALGPVVTLAGQLPPPDKVTIRLLIERAGQNVFDGATSLASMKRPLEELISWLGREMSFPHGAVLLTGTGVVPPDDFSLAVGDVIHIDIAGDRAAHKSCRTTGVTVQRPLAKMRRRQDRLEALFRAPI